MVALAARLPAELSSGVLCTGPVGLSDAMQTELASRAMATTRTTFSLDESLADRARELGVNVSAAARDGVAAAVRSALEQADRRAYLDMPESEDSSWADSEAWGPE